MFLTAKFSFYEQMISEPGATAAGAEVNTADGAA
jgi:hypothetical protein